MRGHYGIPVNLYPIGIIIYPIGIMIYPIGYCFILYGIILMGIKVCGCEGRQQVIYDHDFSHNLPHILLSI